jgi:hypothetical protein
LASHTLKRGDWEITMMPPHGSGAMNGRMIVNAAEAGTTRRASR